MTRSSLRVARRRSLAALVSALVAFVAPIAAGAQSTGTQLTAEPIVVVYPLTPTGASGSSDVGANLATAISTKLVSLGGIVVKPYAPGTARADYLSAALTQGADYYVTGYLTALGSEVSLVEQVVSTRSGSIVYSTTALARTYSDAIDPAVDLREAILRHAGRGLAALDAPPPPSPSPEANSNGHGVGLNPFKAFAHHKPTPAPSHAPAVVAVAATPAPVAALVIATGGGADPSQRAYASLALANALKARGISSAVLAVGAADVAAGARELCSDNGGNGTFYEGSLDVGRERSGASVRYDVTTYDCKARVVGRQHSAATAGSQNNVQTAIESVASRVAAAFTGKH